MISKRPWKLVPLAAMFALGLLLLVPGGTGQPLPVSAAYTCPGTHNIEITIEDQNGDPVTTPGSIVIISPDPTDNAGTRTYTDDGTNDDDSPNETGVILEANACSTSGGDGFTITLDDVPEDSGCTIDSSGDEDTVTNVAGNVSATLLVECIEPNVVIILEAPDDDALEFDFSVTAPGSNDCEGSFVLIDGGEEGLACEADITYTITQDIPSGWTLAIDCSDTGSPSIDIDEDAGTVVFELSGTETIECIFSNEKGATGPATVTVSAAPNAVNCNSISFVSIVVKDAAGLGVADGTAITASTNIGSLNQTSTTTTGGGGGATLIYTSPSNSGGTATITATSGGKSGTATIQVTCSPATAVPPTIAPTATRVPTTSTVSPPSTGDAGLASDGGSGWQLTAVALLITGSLLGGLAVARRRA